MRLTEPKKNFWKTSAVTKTIENKNKNRSLVYSFNRFSLHYYIGYLLATVYLKFEPSNSIIEFRLFSGLYFYLFSYDDDDDDNNLSCIV